MSDKQNETCAKLEIGAPTAWGKIVKYGPAYWCVPDGDTVAVVVSAELIESEPSPCGKKFSDGTPHPAMLAVMCDHIDGEPCEPYFSYCHVCRLERRVRAKQETTNDLYKEFADEFELAKDAAHELGLREAAIHYPEQYEHAPGSRIECDCGWKSEFINAHWNKPEEQERALATLWLHWGDHIRGLGQPHALDRYVAERVAEAVQKEGNAILLHAPVVYDVNSEHRDLWCCVGCGWQSVLDDNLPSTEQWIRHIRALRAGESQE